MRVKLYGTRGSTPGQPRGSHRYGGNTTCLRIISDCIPADTGFAVDAGSGFFDLSKDLLKEGTRKIATVFTHWHHDHSQGLCLAPHTFIGDSFTIWGPQEHSVGPRQVLQRIFAPPLFPVPFAEVAHRFKFKSLESIGTQVLVIHPVGGFALLPVNTFRALETTHEQIAFRSGRFDIKECMIVRMHKTVHPEYTISYRFEERPTGRVFVFLTDQEKQSASPASLRRHLAEADLLVMDAQYAEARYLETAGFGHGTPEYCVQTAIDAHVGRLGLTHHDPNATDDDIDMRLAEALAYAKERMGAPNSIFACADYMELDV